MAFLLPPRSGTSASHRMTVRYKQKTNHRVEIKPLLNHQEPRAKVSVAGECEDLGTS